VEEQINRAGGPGQSQRPSSYARRRVPAARIKRASVSQYAGFQRRSQCRNSRPGTGRSRFNGHAIILDENDARRLRPGAAVISENWIPTVRGIVCAAARRCGRRCRPRWCRGLSIYSARWRKCSPRPQPLYDVTVGGP
jgi:hypothetical protein